MARKSPHNHPPNFWDTPPVLTWLEEVTAGTRTAADAAFLIRNHAASLASKGKEIAPATVEWYVAHLSRLQKGLKKGS